MIAFDLENHRIREKYVKKYFYTFRINQVIFIYGERKKERRNFYGMFSQNLLISAAFTAILKMKLPQCNAIGVRTPPVREGICGFPGAKIVRCEAKNNSSASDIRKLVFYRGILQEKNILAFVTLCLWNVVSCPDHLRRIFYTWLDLDVFEIGSPL